MGLNDPKKSPIFNGLEIDIFINAAILKKRREMQFEFEFLQKQITFVGYF